MFPLVVVMFENARIPSSHIGDIMTSISHSLKVMTSSSHIDEAKCKVYPEK
jgi:hypothetical protein